MQTVARCLPLVFHISRAAVYTSTIGERHLTRTPRHGHLIRVEHEGFQGPEDTPTASLPPSESMLNTSAESPITSAESPDASEELPTAISSNTSNDLPRAAVPAVPPPVTSAVTSAEQDFNASSCSDVAKTSNVQWNCVRGCRSPCSGIEYVQMVEATRSKLRGKATSTSSDCIGRSSYDFDVQSDLDMIGKTQSGVRLDMKRTAAQDCFTGPWRRGDHDWILHISADFLRMATADELVPDSNKSMPAAAEPGVPEDETTANASKPADANASMPAAANASMPVAANASMPAAANASRPADAGAVVKANASASPTDGPADTGAMAAPSAMPARTPELKSGVSDPDFDKKSCAQVANTSNMHWKCVRGCKSACEGIETTTTMEATSSKIKLKGISVSNSSCMAPGDYEFDALFGFMGMVGKTASGVNLDMRRTPGQPCFTGHWRKGKHDFIVHISAHFLPSGKPTANKTDSAAPIGKPTANETDTAAPTQSPTTVAKIDVLTRE